jgi:hypothetical protein
MKTKVEITEVAQKYLHWVRDDPCDGSPDLQVVRELSLEPAEKTKEGFVTSWWLKAQLDNEKVILAAVSTEK